MNSFIQRGCTKLIKSHSKNRVTIRVIFPGCVLARISILPWFKLPRERFENIRNRCHTSISLHTQTKPNPRYFRQYRNPGQDAFQEKWHVWSPSKYIYNATKMCVASCTFYGSSFWSHPTVYFAAWYWKCVSYIIWMYYLNYKHTGL